MKALSLALLAVVAVAATFLAVRQQQSNAELRRTLAQVQQQLQRLEQARAAAPRPATPVDTAAPLAATVGSNETYELARLREEIAELKGSTQQLVQFAKAAAVAANPTATVPDKLVPLAEMKNLGKATPETSVQTALWAAATGEVDTLAQSLTFTPSARAKADAWFASLSEATRQQYGSPEKVIALMIAKDGAALTGVQVLGQKEVTPDDVGVRVRFANDQGKTKDQNFLMRRGNDGWRLTLPDDAVEKYARQLGGGK